jgi:asparagine synthase (glutamine-hydrolysing)
MCGIAGVFNTDGAPVSVSTVRRMTDTIAHRGPNGEGFWVESFVGFGHRRLSIIDLSPLGHQPMQTQDGRYTITYSGEVVNFQNLRIELEALGHSFRSRTDTEVVLHAMQEWGTDALLRFNGMFAFAIWDAGRNELVLARDRFGIKPLYYTVRGNTVVFGSEVKAVLQHPDISPAVDPYALNEYFSFQNIFTDRTLFEGVRLLPAGTFLSARLGSRGAETVQYWDAAFREDNAIDAEEAVEELQRLFDQAVNRQLISDVEIGCYLSGGMDSGAITAVAAKQFPNLRTFTAGFDLSSASGVELGFDERPRAEFLSNRYKTEHYEVVLKAGDMERVMPELVWHLEDLRVGQSYPNYYVARLASRFVRVVLSGAGGDELFAGYPWRYYGSAAMRSRGEFESSYYSYWQRLVPDDMRATFLRHANGEGAHSREAFIDVLTRSGCGSSTPEERVNTSLYFELKTFMHGLLVVEDKLSMAHGLETRVPFLDNDIVDFALRVPVRQKLRDLEAAVRINENDPGRKTERYYDATGDGKLILRRVLGKHVPTDYANGRKQGFSAPDASWFKGDSIDYIRRLLYDKRARIYDFVDPAAVESLLNDHFAGRVNRRLLIWSLVCFEWWCRIFLENGGSPMHPIASARPGPAMLSP